MLINLSMGGWTASSIEVVYEENYQKNNGNTYYAWIVLTVVCSAGS